MEVLILAKKNGTLVFQAVKLAVKYKILEVIK